MATRAETERKKERSGEALETVLATLGTLTDEDLAALHMRVGQALDDRDLDAMAGHWDYERHTWGRGWLQREPKPRRRKNGSIKIYAYWAFHWVENGDRKSRHVGPDSALNAWKNANPSP